MKKFIYLLSLVAVMLLTSCKDKPTFGIEYNLNSDGVANGEVTLIYDAGHFDINGNATYQFEWQNQILFSTSEPKDLDTALAAKDPELSNTALKVNTWLDENISVTAASGTYDIYVKGYVREIATGLTFSINKHFTNIPEDETVEDETVEDETIEVKQ